MAYQNVGRPRFYVNILEWLASSNAITLPSEHYRTLPVNVANYESEDIVAHVQTFTLFNAQSFIAVLGHDGIANGYTLSGDYLSPGENKVSVVNGGVGGATVSPEYSGFSISTFNGIGVETIRVDGNFFAGSVILGTYYDMPHSPDLKLTMSRDLDGVTRVRTKGGSDLVKHQYTKPPLWGTAAPWELYQGNASNQALSRIGRRTWDLSFSYLQGSDVFGSNQHIGTSEWGGQNPDLFDDDDLWSDTSVFKYSLLNDDNFYSQVIHKTNGGQLPFIFQPDSSNNNADGWAIAKLNMKSFRATQVANGIYNMKLKIKEVW